MRRVVPLLALLLCAACDDAANFHLAEEPPPANARLALRDELQRRASSAMMRFGVGDSTRTRAPGALDGRRMLIRNGTMRLRVDSVDVALAAVVRAAGIIGATATSSAAHNGDQQARTAFIELRVVPDGFDRLVEAVRRVGAVEALEIGVHDAGEEYVDVQARIANGRRLETRLIELLQTRTGKLSDVLEVETQLARIREQTDALEGRRRYLEQQVARNTLRVELREPGALRATTGPGLMRVSFEKAWANFLMLVAVVIQSAGVVLPLLLVALAGWRLRVRLRENGTGRSVVHAS